MDISHKLLAEVEGSLLYPVIPVFLWIETNESNFFFASPFLLLLSLSVEGAPLFSLSLVTGEGGYFTQAWLKGDLIFLGKEGPLCSATNHRSVENSSHSQVGLNSPSSQRGRSQKWVGHDFRRNLEKEEVGYRLLANIPRLMLNQVPK